MTAPMSEIAAKVEHVRLVKQSRRHVCHWPSCEHQVPPAIWGCKEHWYRLPLNLRKRIWKTYSVGQELNRTPSPQYVAAVKAVREWIAANG